MIIKKNLKSLQTNPFVKELTDKHGKPKTLKISL